jgi:hypothetical protein
MAGCPRFRAVKHSFETRRAFWLSCAIRSKRLIWPFGANLGVVSLLAGLRGLKRFPFVDVTKVSTGGDVSSCPASGYYETCWFR